LITQVKRTLATLSRNRNEDKVKSNGTDGVSYGTATLGLVNVILRLIALRLGVSPGENISDVPTPLAALPRSTRLGIYVVGKWSCRLPSFKRVVTASP